MCNDIPACAPSEYTPPKQPETGATSVSLIALTVRQFNFYDDGYDGGYANTFQITAEEAKKVRDALNALDL